MRSSRDIRAWDLGAVTAVVRLRQAGPILVTCSGKRQAGQGLECDPAGWEWQKVRDKEVRRDLGCREGVAQARGTEALHAQQAPAL